MPSVTVIRKPTDEEITFENAIIEKTSGKYEIYELTPSGLTSDNLLGSFDIDDVKTIYQK